MEMNVGLTLLTIKGVLIMYIEQFELERFANKSKTVRDLFIKLFVIYQLKYQPDDISVSYEEATLNENMKDEAEELSAGIENMVDSMKYMSLSEEQIDSLLSLFDDEDLLHYTLYLEDENIIKIALHGRERVAYGIVEETFEDVIYSIASSELTQLIKELKQVETNSQDSTVEELHLIKMTRDEIIEELIETDLEHMEDQTLAHILEHGTVGYEECSNEELAEEYYGITEKHIRIVDG